MAVNPANGEVQIIEMNPRVSRSSALASKATGFPIAKIAAKLAVGLTLDQIPNDITRATPASFEPSIDYGGRGGEGGGGGNRGRQKTALDPLPSSRPQSSPRSRASPLRSSPAPKLSSRPR